MNVFELIKSNLNLLTFPNALWGAHVDTINSKIAILHLNPQATDFVNIDKALIIKIVNNSIKVLTMMNNENFTMPHINYNIQTDNDVSNLLFALENYQNINFQMTETKLSDFNISTTSSGKFTNSYFSFRTDEPIVKSYDASSEAVKHVKILTCEFCNKISNNRGTHYKHLRTHAVFRQFLCNTCGKTFRNNYHLNEHLSTHSDSSAKRFHCDMCNKTFSTSSNLRAHIKTHSGERHHVCGTCGKAYTTSSNLQTHIRSIHQDDKPYSCGICEMRFVHPRALRLHMLKHTKERPYKCTFCDKSFPKKVHLTVHTRSHTGEKPYVCGTCGKCFTTSGNMKMHVKMH